jgi:hypothetical protein
MADQADRFDLGGEWQLILDPDCAGTEAVHGLRDRFPYIAQCPLKSLLSGTSHTPITKGLPFTGKRFMPRPYWQGRWL